MCQNITQKEDTWFNGLGDLMWNYPFVMRLFMFFFYTAETAWDWGKKTKRVITQPVYKNIL